MNNAAYGKTIENTENYRNIKFCNKWNNCHKSPGARSLISNPHFSRSKIINENFVIVELKKSEIVYNKPFYIGFSVLEISKTLMYDFHYNYMKIKFQKNLNLLYTDTDSFIYEIQSEDMYQELRDCTRLDTSEYSPNNIFQIPLKNKKKLGFFKDENKGNIMLEFVGLRSKLYAMRVDNNNMNKDIKDSNVIIKKAKGIAKIALKNQITFDNYLDCLNHNSSKYCDMIIFRSIKHNIFTQRIKKLALNSSDDKRCLIPNSNETYAWGHTHLENTELI